MSLFDSLSNISDQIQRQRKKMEHNEDATKLVSVQPFIRALGYDTQNLGEVFPEFKADAKISGGERVDYAILSEDKPIIFIEAKAVNILLNESNWKQLYNYFNAKEVNLGILTNGIMYRFYADLEKPNIMDKEPFLEVDLLNLDKQKVQELEEFTKERFDSIKSIHFMKISRKVNQVLTDPVEWLVRHVLTNIHEGSKRKAVINEYRPLVKRAIDVFVDQEIARRDTGDPPEPGPKPPPPIPPVCSEFIPVFGNYDGHRLEAELLRKSIEDGLTIAGNQIRYNGETTWLKDAAVKAIRSVNPSFEPTKTYPNGFKFWHVVDPDDGKEHMIRHISGWDNITDETLRQRVLNGS